MEQFPKKQEDPMINQQELSAEAPKRKEEPQKESDKTKFSTTKDGVVLTEEEKKAQRQQWNDVPDSWREQP